MRAARVSVYIYELSLLQMPLLSAKIELRHKCIGLLIIEAPFFTIGKNAGSILASSIVGNVETCVAARSHAFFGAWLRLRTFLLSERM